MADKILKHAQETIKKTFPNMTNPLSSPTRRRTKPPLWAGMK